jgi:hypothetical protein
VSNTEEKHEPGTTSERVVATYDMDEDAMGLADWIGDRLRNQDSPVAYVENAEGGRCIRAEWVEATLTDGSKTYDLRLHFN